MALSNQEKTALRAIIARDGLDATLDAMRQVTVNDKKAAALTALQGAVSMTVSDWPAVAASVAAQGNDTLVSVIGDIKAAMLARDASNLASLLIQQFAATKAHLGV